MTDGLGTAEKILETAFWLFVLLILGGGFIFLALLSKQSPLAPLGIAIDAVLIWLVFRSMSKTWSHEKKGTE